MANPGLPDIEPVPGDVPTEVPPVPNPDGLPEIGPSSPDAPSPVSEPGKDDPHARGSHQDELPGAPTGPGTRL